MIIDFHTHAFPDKLAPGALAHLTENARAYAHLYGEAHPHTDATLDGLTASARRAGIDFSLVLPIATSPKPSRTINDFAAQADKHPGLRSFGSVHPVQIGLIKRVFSGAINDPGLLEKTHHVGFCHGSYTSRMYHITFFRCLQPAEQI